MSEELKSLESYALIAYADQSDPMIEALSYHLRRALAEIEDRKEIQRSIEQQLAEMGITLTIDYS